MGYATRGRQESVYGILVDNFILTKDLKATHVKYRFDGIATAGTGTGTLFTTDAGLALFYPTAMIVVVSAQSGTVTTPPTISIGTNAATFNNIIGATAQTGLVGNTNGLYVITRIAAVTTLGRVPASTAVSYNVSVAITGGGTQTVSVIVEGFYEDLAGATQLVAG